MEVHDSRLPVFSKKKAQILQLYNLREHQNLAKEVVEKIVEDQGRQHFEEVDEVFDITHSYIDLRLMLMNEKMKKLVSDDFDESQVILSDDFDIANLISSQEHNMDFYLQYSIQRMIDYQFQKTKHFMQKLWIMYLMFCYVPFILSIMIDSDLVDSIFLTMALIIQILFFLNECINIKQEPLEYFRDVWNQTDLAEFIVYLIFYCIKFNESFSQVKDFTEILLSLFILILGFFKVLFYLRIYDDFGFLVSMIYKTMQQLIPFLVFFFLWVFFFSMCFIILQTEIDDRFYPAVNRDISLFLHTYRNSIGDIFEPQYTRLLETEDNLFTPTQRTQNTVLIVIIWFTWLGNQFLNLIILLNFLIAVISQVYDQVVAQQKLVMYKDKADMNREYYMLLKFFDQLGSFDTIGLSLLRVDTSIDQNENLGFVQSIKNAILIEHK